MVELRYEETTKNSLHVMKDTLFLGVIRREGTIAKWYFKASEFHEFCSSELAIIADKVFSINGDKL